MNKKRNISLFVLTFEIAAIVILHAVKMNSPQPPVREANSVIAKSKNTAPVIKPYPSLLSIK